MVMAAVSTIYVFFTLQNEISNLPKILERTHAQNLNSLVSQELKLSENDGCGNCPPAPSPPPPPPDQSPPMPTQLRTSDKQKSIPVVPINSSVRSNAPGSSSVSGGCSDCPPPTTILLHPQK